MSHTSSHFDADAYLAAFARPELTIGGRRYVGRLLSLDEFLRLSAVLDEARTSIAARAGEAWTPEALQAEYRRLARATRVVADALFPQPWWRRVLSPWQPSAAQQLARLPVAAQVEALNSFLSALQQGMERQQAAQSEAQGELPLAPGAAEA